MRPAEFYETGDLTPETLEKFSEMSSKELVETYLEMQKNNPTSAGRDLTESEVNVIYQQARWSGTV